MTDETSDAGFTDRALNRLPAVMATPGFEAALLAAYDGWRVHRPSGLWAALSGAARGFFELVWPGAPIWAPAGALAASLLIGVGLGVALPAQADERASFSLERTPGFTFLSTDPEEDL